MTDDHIIELVKLMRQWADACVKMLELEREERLKRTGFSGYTGIYQQLLEKNKIEQSNTKEEK